MLFACAEGTDVQADAAPRYFEENRAALEHLIAMVDACRPARSGSSFSRVFAHRPRANEGLYCRRQGASIHPIVQSLQQQNLAAIDYWLNDEDSSEAPLAGAQIMIYSVGLASSGRSVSFLYVVNESDASKLLEREAPDFLERRPLTSAPHHWFWEEVT